MASSPSVTAASPGAKIKDLDELAAVLDAHRRRRERVVHCHGVFDLLHIGHIRHFEQARKLGDVLVVTLTPDRYVNKGPHRPAFPAELRAEAVGLASIARCRNKGSHADSSDAAAKRSP